ncbi:peptidase M6 [Shewanella sp. Choline-02u-19]|uniref:immune inhibitor A domain-containing protein n=1 Tax=unclassified Shewanella TaxID=196818 RepID=UPI000C330F34|nr:MULTISPECIES: immune inhibitor A domain-containing protein [unclassified Shewanella]PKH58239.1 peptidase M6 [Shewanella sp. Bg11-22]PKI29498.1 peptidase M6 [Shewanella sp. Choline-02u-19]
MKGFFQKSAVISFLLSALVVMNTALAVPIYGTTADANIVDKERVLYWLIKRGEVASSASDTEKKQAVEAFIARSRGARKISLREARYEAARLQQKKQTNKFVSFTAAQTQSITNKTVKVLAVLIDFPDLPYDKNGLSSSDTSMYYSAYTAEHYNNLLFSTNGYAGPTGQTLMTGYEYYQAESGGSFFFTGDVKGWYRAANNAAAYGGNDDADDDIGAIELVKEAVSAATAQMSSTELATYDVEDPFDVNQNGNLNEPDGEIDHVMIFHSSIGEETGGGMLGADAIWSHRSSITPYTIPGTSMKLSSYTIQPIDAALGVCVHEFGHDLGLPDEYDISAKGKGSPVGFWSVMASGSWSGAIRGTEPTGFSPYARSYLQGKYQGNWVSEQKVLLNTLDSSGLDIALVEAVNHDQVNQVSLAIPAEEVSFTAPYAGDYQFYSDQGDMINHAMSFDIELPVATPLTLLMKAHWSIELDYDYAQIMVDGIALEGRYTKASNGRNSARNIITGKSSDLAAAEGTNGWVELEYDLSPYAGRNVRLAINYVTDQAVGDYGIVIDDISINQADTVVLFNGAETLTDIAYAGFLRVTDTRPGKDRRYIVQLRSLQGVDKGLKSQRYDPGVVLWLENNDYSSNEVSKHAGYSLIGVVDADQNLIGSLDSEFQIRDAAFSLFNQSFFSYGGSSDEHLSANKLFDDASDYTAPLQPESGMALPELGLSIEVMTQAENSRSATVQFKYSGMTEPSTELSAVISQSQQGAQVTFTAAVSGGDGTYQYAWDFGVDGATSIEAAASYTYNNAGSYLVTLTITDGNGVEFTNSTTVNVSAVLDVGFTLTVSGLSVTFNNKSVGGSGELSYAWQFGDGATSIETSPSHTYVAAGDYNVILTVTDSLGKIGVMRGMINVASAVTTTTTQKSSSSGGGLGMLSIGLLCLLAGYRRKIMLSGRIDIWT